MRNAEPLIRRLDTEKKHAAWLGDVQVNLASAAIIMAMFGLLFMAADEPVPIFFVIPGFLVYMLFATLGSFDDDKIKRIRLYAAAAAAVALIAVLVIFRKYIGNGWALIMNQLYDTVRCPRHIYTTGSISARPEGASVQEHAFCRYMGVMPCWASRGDAA